MDKNQFIRKIAKENNLYIQDVKKYLTLICEEIIAEMEKGETIKIYGFGTFVPVEFEESSSILNGKRYYVPPYKIIKFKNGKALRDRLKKTCHGESGKGEIAEQ